MTAFGFLVATLVLFSSFQERAVEIPAGDDTEETIVSELSYEAVPSASQEPVERTSYLIEVLPDMEVESDFHIPFDVLFSGTTKIFEVVFEHIISPNSP